MKPIKVEWAQPEHWYDLTEWTLLEAFEINGYLLVAGEKSNGGSIPWGLRNAFNSTGKGFPAFFAHDKKCNIKGYPRKQADKELLRDLITCGVNERRAKAMYGAVRFYSITTGKR